MYYKITLDSETSLKRIIGAVLLIPNCEKVTYYIESIVASSISAYPMRELEENCLIGDYGKKVNIAFIQELFSSIRSLDDMLILGGTINDTLLDFKEPESIYKSVQYVIEYFDSAEWNISTHDYDYFMLLKSFFKDSNPEYQVLY